MAETKIAKYIEQPHQRFIYVFDPNAQWIFLIEMIKISVAENPKITYPVIVKSEGKAPKQYKQLKAIKDELSPEMLLMKKAKDDEVEDVEDDEIYKALNTGEEGVEEDDIKNLEGEEGEESEEGTDELGEETEDDDYSFGEEHEED